MLVAVEGVRQIREQTHSASDGITTFEDNIFQAWWPLALDAIGRIDTGDPCTDDDNVDV